ncbi:hypothetical protein LCGC14_1768050 [marine sediment metagenome]|uniref:Competence protein CoiA-like family protein n=1 Tax=marine sediment metagenome TaxID=412755 RepID=A0A0F9GZ33_9ZZZZ|nr:hypothetical protein [Candidatus Anoxychlamydiales bacterium]
MTENKQLINMKPKKIKLPFGLNENNILVHITYVERGKKCYCVCPSCRSPLIAAKGSKKQPHFKHAVVNECEGGMESAIHLAAKQMIMEKKQITLPKYVSIASATDSRGIKHTEGKTVVEDGTVITFDSVQEETELHGMKADILAKKGNKSLIIEIFYRHKVEDQKLVKITEANISAIEINLSDLTPEDVKNWETFWLCINDPRRVQWLHYAKAHPELKKQLEMKIQAQIQEQEEEYKQEEIREKKVLSRALYVLKTRPRKQYIAYLKQKAETSPVRKFYTQNLPFSWPDLPDFVNADIPNGDWIFGCDRRVWQTAFYKSFIWIKEESFSVRRVHNWLQHIVKINKSVEAVEIYGSCYPCLVSADIYASLPSSCGTLRAYFNYLCELGMLEFSGDELGDPGSCWFRVVSKSARCSPEQMAHLD